MKYTRITEADHMMLWDHEHGLVPPGGSDGVVLIDGAVANLSQVQFDNMVPEEAKAPRRRRADGGSDAPAGHWRITIEFEPEESKP